MYVSVRYINLFEHMHTAPDEHMIGTADPLRILQWPLLLIYYYLYTNLFEHDQR